MKNTIGLWFGLSGMLFAGDLTFTETLKELKPAPEETLVTVDYPFTNNSGKTVIIKEAGGGCSCMSVQVSDGKKAFAPGESGVIRANFDMGTFWGTVDKVVSIWAEGDPEAAPSQLLTLRVHIPVLIEAEPKTVKWDVGEAAEAKTIKIRMMGDKPIHIKSIDPRGGFTQELKTIEDGKSYELSIKPASTKAIAIGIFRINTDCEIERHAVQQVFAAIRNSDVAGNPPTPVK